MMSSEAKISIVTVVKNGMDVIESTILSIPNLGCPSFEYIIIDGGSTDGTLDVIKRYSDRLALWISEPDGGIYSAMNRGLRAASGEYVLFLNAGDILTDGDVFSEALTILNDGCDILVADYYIEQLNGKRVYVSNLLDDGWDIKSGKLPGCHQAMFIRRNLFEKVGGWSERYKVASDYEWFVRLFAVGKRDGQYPELKSMRKPVVVYREGGFSEKCRFLGFKEVSDIVYNNFGALSFLRYSSSKLIKLAAIEVADALGLYEQARHAYRKHICS